MPTLRESNLELSVNSDGLTISVSAPGTVLSMREKKREKSPCPQEAPSLMEKRAHKQLCTNKLETEYTGENEQREQKGMQGGFS